MLRDGAQKAEARGRFRAEELSDRRVLRHPDDAAGDDPAGMVALCGDFLCGSKRRLGAIADPDRPAADIIDERLFECECGWRSKHKRPPNRGTARCAIPLFPYAALAKSSSGMMAQGGPAGTILVPFPPRAV